MEIYNFKQLNWINAEPENLQLGLFPKEWDGKMSIVQARLQPRETMTEHYHNRPEQGSEVYFFYKGAHCIITADGESKEFDTREPFYWLIKNREKHKIENLADEVLEFQAIYAPGFVMGEVEYVR